MGVVPSFARLGLIEIVTDHFKTLYVKDENNEARFSVSDLVVFYGIPAIMAVISIIFKLKLSGLAEIIAGISIFTALLFGLLIHVFSVGLSIKGKKNTPRWGRIETLLDETRANISYTCGVGLLANVVCMSTAALTSDMSKGVNPIASSLIILTLSHMALTLLMILKRIRNSYMEISSSY